MRVLVCVKRVPAPGSRINVTDDGQAVDTAFLGFTTSPHEECAVEAAVQLVELHGGSTTVLTVGPSEAEEQLRYAASLGVGGAVLVETDGADWDPQRTTRAISDAISAIEAESGSFDVLLFGNESADSGGFQVGIRVARALGRPIVNAIKGIEVTDGVLRCRRETDRGVEVYELPTPCAVGVKEGINLPRYPTMKSRLASKKVEVVRFVPDGAPGAQRMRRLVPPPADNRTAVRLGEGPAAAAAVVDLLVQLEVV